MLQDLPPKITQDYYCDLSPLQRILYEDFRTRHSALTNSSSSSNDSQSHVFEALRYLRNVCNHPKLVLSQSHPLYRTVRIKKRKYLEPNILKEKSLKKEINIILSHKVTFLKFISLLLKLAVISFLSPYISIFLL